MAEARHHSAATRCSPCLLKLLARECECRQAGLNQLVEQGNTVIVIEHNLDVIKTADYVIDLGPEGGEGGGNVVAAGSPEDVARTAASHTGAYLKHAIK